MHPKPNPKKRNEAIPAKSRKALTLVQSSPNTNPRRVQLLTLFLVLSAFMHFVSLSYPSGNVFDEVYYGRAIRSFHDRQTCFTGHPPHSLLVMTAISSLAGYHGGGHFEKIGLTNDPKMYWQMRLGPALIGTLLPVLFFLFIEALGGSLAAATLGAAAVLFDNAILTQTRTIAQDGFLLFWMFSALLVTLYAAKTRSLSKYGGKLVFAGALAGMASGTKFTGITAPVMVILIIAMGYGSEGASKSLSTKMLGIVSFLSGFALAYFAGFWVYFSMLSGSADSVPFFVRTGHFFADTISYQRAAFGVHENTTQNHPYGSSWWSWPLLRRPIYLWTNLKAQLYLLGNPVLWWGSSALVALIASVTLLSVNGTSRFALSRERWRKLVIPAIGFFIAYLPHVMIRRVMFLYHYLPSLGFVIAFCSLWLDDSGWISKGDLREQKKSYYFVLFLFFGGFALFSPITLGYAAPQSYYNFVFSIFPR